MAGGKRYVWDTRGKGGAAVRKYCCEESLGGYCPTPDQCHSRGICLTAPESIRVAYLTRRAKDTLVAVGSYILADLEALTVAHDKLRESHADLLAACKKAVHELNEIRARDGVPYTHNGWRAGVSEEYFSSVVDECFSAIARAEAARG